MDSGIAWIVIFFFKNEKVNFISRIITIQLSTPGVWVAMPWRCGVASREAGALPQGRGDVGRSYFIRVWSSGVAPGTGGRGCFSTFRSSDVFVFRGPAVGMLERANVPQHGRGNCGGVGRCNLWMLQRLDVQMLRLWNSSVFHCLNVPVSQRCWVATLLGGLSLMASAAVETRSPAAEVQDWGCLRSRQERLRGSRR